jgi:hypothetical protein
MRGTEKQIAWAEKIRSAAKEAFKKDRGFIGDSPIAIFQRKAAERFFSQDRASYWIDNRNSIINPSCDFTNWLLAQADLMAEYRAIKNNAA